MLQNNHLYKQLHCIVLSKDENANSMPLPDRRTLLLFLFSLQEDNSRTVRKNITAQITKPEESHTTLDVHEHEQKLHMSLNEMRKEREKQEKRCWLLLNLLDKGLSEK